MAFFVRSTTVTFSPNQEARGWPSSRTRSGLATPWARNTVAVFYNEAQQAGSFWYSCE